MSTYLKYAIDPNEIQTVVKNGVAIGFEVKTKIPYYRGVSLSLVDTVKITLDGREYGPEDMTFTLGEDTYTLDEMSTMPDLRWEFGEKMTIFVKRPGGIHLGTHTVDVFIGIRVSYMGMVLPFRQSFTVCPMGG